MYKVEDTKTNKDLILVPIPPVINKSSSIHTLGWPSVSNLGVSVTKGLRLFIFKPIMHKSFFDFLHNFAYIFVQI